MKTTVGHIAAMSLMSILLLASGVLPAEDDKADCAIANEPRSTEQLNRERARQAIEVAASEAAKRIKENTKLDLDIRLIGRSSTAVATTR